MEDCLICAEKYNSIIHKKITCPYCNFEACKKCCQTYILDKEMTICMNVNKKENGDSVCQKQWSRKFMVDNFSNNWLNTKWKNMKEKVGFDTEKALLPATVPILQRKKDEDKLKNEIQKIQEQINLLWRKQGELRNNFYSNNNNNNENPERNYRGRPCPDEICRGYLSNQWKCGICEMWTCPECHVIKGLTRDTAHTCNENDVATAKLLNSDTKPCPSCRTPIFKIMGCDQMWCTQCHTGFSWRTGMIQNSHIHNPHYFEWQRQQTDGNILRNPGDVECGQDLSDSVVLMSIRRELRSMQDIDLSNYEKQYENIIRSIIHLDRVQAPRFRINNVQNNIDLRISYLEKKIDEKKFCASILRREKANEKKQDLFNVIQLEVRAVTDIIYRMESEIKSIDKSSLIGQLQIKNNMRIVCEKYLDEIKNITIYANNLLKEHSKTYNCKLYKIKFSNNSSRYGHDILI